MKKARIMLAIIVVVAGVGTALAFRARFGVNTNYYRCNTGVTPQTCYLSTAVNLATTNMAGAQVTVMNATFTSINVAGQNCNNGMAPCNVPVFFKADQ